MDGKICGYFPEETSRIVKSCLFALAEGELGRAITEILLKMKTQILFFVINFREHSITIPSFGATEVLTTFEEARLALTYKRQSYRPFGPHPSPRYALV